MEIQGSFFDTSGLEAQIAADQTSLNLQFLNPSQKAYVMSLFQKLLSQPTSAELVRRLAFSSKNIAIFHGESGKFKKKKEGLAFSKRWIELPLQKIDYEGRIPAVYVNRIDNCFSRQRRPFSFEQSPSYITLAHELIHAYHSVNYKTLGHMPPRTEGYTNLEEENTIIGVPGCKDFTENDIRREFGLRERSFHLGVYAKQDPYRAPGKLMLA